MQWDWTVTNRAWAMIGVAIKSSANSNVTLVDTVKIDASTTAGDTRLMLYDVDNGTLERVTVGAADSGGSGFKVLRIPN